MGINTNFIVPEMRDFLPMSTCSICSTILEDVITIKCSHHFCKSCLHHWIQNYEISELDSVPCPKCENRFNPTNDTNKCHTICDVLSVLKFICSNQLCEEIIGYHEYHGHHQLCLYSPISCKFCKIKVLRKDLDTHLSACIPYIISQKSQFEIENEFLKTENDRLRTKTDLLESKITSQTNSLMLEDCDNAKIKVLVVENKTLKSEVDSLTTKLELVKIKTSTLTIKLKRLETETDLIIGSLKTNNDMLKRQCNLEKKDNNLVKTEKGFLDVELKTKVEKDVGLLYIVFI